MKAAAFAVAALAVACVMAAEDDMSAMSKTQLIAALTKSNQENSEVTAELDAAHNEITDMQQKMDIETGIEDDHDEEQRKADERKHKKAVKQKAEAEEQAKLNKKSKLSDILMEHGAKFLAMKAAKDTKDKGSTVQNKKVLEAARKGGRAGAAGPLGKVIRSAAVKAVKKARKNALSMGITHKDKIREVTSSVAKVVVMKLLADQDKLVEKTAKKWTAAAIKKFPPTMLLDDDDDDEPNNFVAPPSIHLSLDGSTDSEVQPIEESKEVTADVPSVHISLDDSKTSSVKVAKAAAAAKKAAGKVVPEQQ